MNMTRKDTTFDIVQVRDRVVGLVEESLKNLKEAERLMREAGCALASFDVTTEKPYTRGLEEQGVARFYHIDRDLWMQLYNKTLSQYQTASQRHAFSHALYQDGDYAEFTQENLIQTMMAYQTGAPDAFVQSVYELWRLLDGSYVCNDAAAFTSKAIIKGFADPSRAPFRSVSRYYRDVLADIARIASLYDDMDFDASTFQGWEGWRDASWHDFEHLRIKVFKNGNAHIMFGDALRERLNKTLATAAGRALHSR